MKSLIVRYESTTNMLQKCYAYLSYAKVFHCIEIPKKENVMIARIELKYEVH